MEALRMKQCLSIGSPDGGLLNFASLFIHKICVDNGIH